MLLKFKGLKLHVFLVRRSNRDLSSTAKDLYELLLANKTRSRIRKLNNFKFMPVSKILKN